MLSNNNNKKRQMRKYLLNSEKKTARAREVAVTTLLIDVHVCITKERFISSSLPFSKVKYFCTFPSSFSSLSIYKQKNMKKSTILFFFDNIITNIKQQGK